MSCRRSDRNSARQTTGLLTGAAHMSITHDGLATSRPPLRLWPGIALAALLLVVRLGAPLVSAEGSLIGALGAVFGGLLIVIWWLFFSRAPWTERLAILAVMIAAVFATRAIVHPSIRGGMMGLMLPLFLAIPGLGLALVAALVIARGRTPRVRQGVIVAAILLACAGFTLLRTDGLMGGNAQLAWRWTPTAEERLLAKASVEPAVPAARPAPAPVPPAAALSPSVDASAAPPRTNAEKP